MEIGNVVILNSGGPKMTVSSIVPSGATLRILRCVWFGTDGVLREGNFAEKSLSHDETTKAE